jgi:DNA-binding CsgD family transcriptional regulator
MRDDPRAPVTAAADLLLTLSDQSLLAQGPNPANRDRYTLLETIREYGLEQLAAHGELEAAQGAQAAFVRDLVSRVQLATGDGIPDQGWVSRLDDERGNIRVALYWWIKRGDSEPALATAGALVNYWWMRSDFGEGRSWCERALSLAMTVASQSGLESSLYGACVMASNQGDHARALEAGRAMLREAQARDAPVATIRAHYALCRAARRAGEAELALEHALAALALAREHVEPIWQAWVLSFLAESPDIVGPERAEAAAHEALAHFREQRSAWGQANTLQSLALFAVARGEFESAVTLLDESLTWREQVGERTALVEGLACVADFAVRRGQHEEAAVLLGAIQAWGGVQLDTPAALDHLHLARTVTTTRQALPAERFAWRRAEGAALTRREALATARALLQELTPDGAPPTSAGALPVVTARRHEPVPVEALTRREREVLGLLAERLSDAEIASRLFIGTRTAEFHVANINSKLGAANRREATAIAARMGLL